MNRPSVPVRAFVGVCVATAMVGLGSAPAAVAGTRSHVPPPTAAAESADARALAPLVAATRRVPAAAVVTDTQLDTSQLAVRSSTGRRLFVSVEAETANTRHGRPFTSLDISLGDEAGENHDWTLQVSNRTFAYHSATARGIVTTTKKEMAPLGVVDLSIAPHGQPTSTTCSSKTTSLSQPVIAKGTLVFHTHTRGWGTVGSRAVPVRFAGPSVVVHLQGPVDNSCDGGGAPATCSAGAVSWNSQGGLHGVFFGGSYLSKTGKPHGYIFFLTDRSVPQTLDADEETFDYVTTALPPTLTTNGDGTSVVTIDAGQTGLITGTATLTSVGDPSPEPGACRKGSDQKWAATWHNGAQPLTVNNIATRAFVQKNQPPGATTGADFDLQSVPSTTLP